MAQHSSEPQTAAAASRGRRAARKQEAAVLAASGAGAAAATAQPTCMLRVVARGDVSDPRVLESAVRGVRPLAVKWHESEVVGSKLWIRFEIDSEIAGQMRLAFGACCQVEHVVASVRALEWVQSCHLWTDDDGAGICEAENKAAETAKLLAVLAQQHKEQGCPRSNKRERARRPSGGRNRSRRNSLEHDEAALTELQRATDLAQRPPAGQKEEAVDMVTREWWGTSKPSWRRLEDEPNGVVAVAEAEAERRIRATTEWAARQMSGWDTVEKQSRRLAEASVELHVLAAEVSRLLQAG